MIDTQALKKRIYDMAISGQLTRHLVDDTPVDLSLLSYQEEGVDLLPEIPETWKYCYFDDVLINRDSERIPVSVADRKKLSKKYDYYGASGVIDKVDNYLFDENLLLIGEDGANLLSRSTPIAFIAKGKYWVNNHAHVLQATEHVLLEYVEIYINAISLVPYVTGSAQPKLSQHMMSKIPVPVPPIEEQQRIVETVRSVSEHLGLIDTLQSQYQDNLAALKSKIIDAGIQGKLTEQLPEDGTAEELYQQIQQEKLALEKAGKIKKSKPLPPISDEEKPFDIPENWKWVSVGDVCTNIQYGTSKKSSETGKVPVIRMGNLQGGRIVYDKLAYTSDDSEIEKYPLEVNDLLFNRTNSMELVGKTAIYKGEMPAIYAGYLVRVTPVLMVSDYLNYVMQTKYYWDYCRMVRIDANGQSNINAEKLKRFVFPLPPLAEQKRIVAKLEELLPLCEGK